MMIDFSLVFNDVCNWLLLFVCNCYQIIVNYLRIAPSGEVIKILYCIVLYCIVVKEFTFIEPKMFPQSYMTTQNKRAKTIAQLAAQLHSSRQSKVNVITFPEIHEKPLSALVSINNRCNCSIMGKVTEFRRKNR